MVDHTGEEGYHQRLGLNTNEFSCLYRLLNFLIFFKFTSNVLHTNTKTYGNCCQSNLKKNFSLLVNEQETHLVPPTNNYGLQPMRKRRSPLFTKLKHLLNFLLIA